jgi:ABC-type multidrug transport system fused ATPase/permease subunit
MVSAIDMPQTMPQQLPPQTGQPVDETEPAKVMIAVRDLDFAYGSHQVLHKVALEMPARPVPAFIGPSGCG